MPTPRMSVAAPAEQAERRHQRALKRPGLAESAALSARPRPDPDPIPCAQGRASPRGTPGPGCSLTR